MPQMMVATKEIVIEAEKVIMNFENEELRKKDEEQAQEKRTVFQFGG